MLVLKKTANICTHIAVSSTCRNLFSGPKLFSWTQCCDRRGFFPSAWLVSWCAHVLSPIYHCDYPCSYYSFVKTFGQRVHQFHLTHTQAFKSTMSGSLWSLSCEVHEAWSVTWPHTKKPSQATNPSRNPHLAHPTAGCIAVFQLSFFPGPASLVMILYIDRMLKSNC